MIKKFKVQQTLWVECSPKWTKAIMYTGISDDINKTEKKYGTIWKLLCNATSS